MRDEPRTIGGRYVLHEPISAGGMASVHFGRLLGPSGFARTVAIKRMHRELARDEAFVARFLDEARLAARIHHPNVVGTLDVAAEDGELFLVMDYVPGLSLSFLLREAGEGARMPPEHGAAIVIGVLHGLHAAHEATSESGEPLAIVHRDVSPPNVLVGEDGVARIIDFGVAKAAERVHATQDQNLVGKVRYMAPEQIGRRSVDRRADVYAAAVILWELLTGRSYIEASGNAVATVAAAQARVAEAPSTVAAGVPAMLDAVVLRGLAKEPADRYATAMEMAADIESAVRASSQRAIAEWVAKVAGTKLRQRAEVLRRIESDRSSVSAPKSERRSSAPPPGQLVVLPVDAPRAPDAPAVVVVPSGGAPQAVSAVLAGVVIALVAGIVWLRWFAGEPAPAAADPTSATAIETANATAPATANVPATANATKPAPETATSPATATATATTTATANANANATLGAARRPAPGRCNPPWTLVDGIRVPKQGCL